MKRRVRREMRVRFIAPIRAAYLRPFSRSECVASIDQFCWAVVSRVTGDNDLRRSFTINLHASAYTSFGIHSDLLPLLDQSHLHFGASCAHFRKRCRTGSSSDNSARHARCILNVSYTECLITRQLLMTYS